MLPRPVATIALASLAAAHIGCSGHHACPAFVMCVSSQAEADQLNAGADCRNYAYCPAQDGGAQDALAGDALTEAEVIDSGCNQLPDATQYSCEAEPPDALGCRGDPMYCQNQPGECADATSVHPAGCWATLRTWSACNANDPWCCPPLMCQCESAQIDGGGPGSWSCPL